MQKIGICGSCKATSALVDWDKETLARTLNRKQRRNYVPITKALNVTLWYVCPSCKCGIYLRNISRKELRDE